MKASVIIPTLGTRRDYLADTLKTVKQQDFSKDEYEIVAVENGPKGAVFDVVEKTNREIKEGPQIRYVQELKPGVTNARHTGAIEAQADVLVFIGDDVLTPPNWLEAVVKPFEDSQVGCAGGKLIAKWDVPIPAWFSQLKHMALGMLDLGDETLELKGPQIWGDNLAVRKEVLFEVGGFNPDIYGYGDKRFVWFSGDGEIGFEKRILKHKYKIIYEPKAWVHHRVPASRTKKEYFYARSYVLAIGSSFGQVQNNMRGKSFLPLRLFAQSIYYFLKAGVLLLKSYLKREEHIRIKSRAFHFAGKAQHQLRAAFSKRIRDHIFQESYIQRGQVDEAIGSHTDRSHTGIYQ